MKLLNKVKISLLIILFIIISFNLKVYAVTGTITEITVNMRKEPSTDSKKLMYVTQDYKVEVLEKVGEWYKIKYNGVTGYVFGKYVEVDDSKLEVKEETKVPEKEEDVKPTTKPEETDKNEETVDSNIQDVTTNVDPELQIKEKTDVRLVPNITSCVIYTSKEAKTIDVIEQFGNWSYIYIENIAGWVRTDNVVEKNTVKESTSTEDETEDEEVTITEKIVAYIKYDTVNLRKKASTSSTVLSKLKLNNEVIILEKVNSTWTKVEYDGITGYVSSDLLASEKQKEKAEKEDTTSRDGESVSRDEEVENKKEETKVENNSSDVKEENTSNKDKENVSETKKEETKKEETKEPVKEDKKETNTESETKKEETIKPDTNKEEEKEVVTESETKKEETKEPIEEDKKETNTESETKKEETTTSKNETSSSSKAKGEEIAKYAQKFLGYEYVYGGASPKTGFDCSGLTSYVYKQFGYTLSRTSTQQAKNGKEVSKDKLQPGDLLIFKNQELTRIGHVGIYIGNNKMIHASEPGIGVVITDLDARGYNYNKRFVTARRIV